MSETNTGAPDVAFKETNPAKSESDVGHTDSDVPKEELPAEDEITYPEGGARGWAVAAGGATILFSTFGYANAFGQVYPYHFHPIF